MIHYDAMKPLNTSGGGGGGPYCIYDGFRYTNLKMWLATRRANVARGWSDSMAARQTRWQRR